MITILMSMLIQAPAYCTGNTGPAQVPFGAVCTGQGTQCYMSYNNCSPLPNVPGTWGPGGYTPKVG